LRLPSSKLVDLRLIGCKDMCSGAWSASRYHRNSPFTVVHRPLERDRAFCVSHREENNERGLLSLQNVEKAANMVMWREITSVVCCSITHGLSEACKLCEACQTPLLSILMAKP
jgi:hypothetical protein